MEFHKAAAIFPLMGEAELSGLKEDIKEHGLIEPICTHDGLIVDGRNRFIACEAVGVEPEFCEWDGDGSLVSFIISLNLKRRHLSSSQRAVVALDALPMLEAEAKERRLATLKKGASVPERIPERDDGESRDKAAEITNTNPRYVSDAKKIRDEEPDLLDEVRAGAKTIPEAKKEIRKRDLDRARAENRETEQDGARVLRLDDARAAYSCVYLDPPWRYDDAGCRGAAEPHYDADTDSGRSTMSVEELEAFPLPGMLCDDAHVWMWITWPMIRDGAAHRVLDAWGLQWKGEIVWDKETMGPGRWVRSQTEVLILAVKGNLQRLSESTKALHRERRGGHSEKPDAFYTIIEEFSPGPRIELFARRGREGWDRWGNES